MDEESVGMIAAAAVTVTVTIASVLSALIPDEKLPKWLAAILNLLAANVGKAKNAPGQ
jgi:hypothetical protein